MSRPLFAHAQSSIPIVEYLFELIIGLMIANFTAKHNILINIVGQHNGN